MSARGAATVGFILVGAVAAVPFLSALDGGVVLGLEPWRTCGGKHAFNVLCDVVRPLGVALVLVLLVRQLRGGPPPRLGHALAILAAWGAGTLLVEALKDAIDRPRPGAEFLTSVGNAFPSGHVGNTVLVGFVALCLWSGRPGARQPAGRLLAMVVAVAIVAFARVYLGRHWTSDVLGTMALFGGYGVLAFLHPDGRWRAGTIATTFVVAVGLQAASAAGPRWEMPAGTRAYRAPSVGRIAFGRALAAGALEGQWSPDSFDARRESAWLRSAAGQLNAPGVDVPIEEVRIVARPHPFGGSAACRRLAVAVNGVPLGERLLHFGWRGYVFPAPPGAVRAGDNVFTFTVRNDLPDGRRPGAPLVALAELTLHAAAVPP